MGTDAIDRIGDEPKWQTTTKTETPVWGLSEEIEKHNDTRRALADERRARILAERARDACQIENSRLVDARRAAEALFDKALRQLVEAESESRGYAPTLSDYRSRLEYWRNVLSRNEHP